jgi:hypothetical protein
MKNYALSLLLSGVAILFLPIISSSISFGHIAGTPHPFFCSILSVSSAYAGNVGDKRSPYGHSKSSTYGEKKTVTTAEQAEDILQEYFSGKEVMIGEIREKKLYFEADILGGDKKIIDSVIIDKRTGRIRSIY